MNMFWLGSPARPGHEAIEEVDNFRPRWLPPRETVEMAVVYTAKKGLKRVKGGRHLKQSQAYPIGCLKLTL